MNRYKEAITVDNELITRFSNSQNPIIQEAVAQALANKGNNFQALARSKEIIDEGADDKALAIDNEVITRFGNSQNPKIQEAVAQALANKGNSLTDLKRYKEALAIDNEMITRFGNSPNLAIQRRLMVTKLERRDLFAHLNLIDQVQIALERSFDNFNLIFQKGMKMIYSTMRLILQS